MKPNLKPLVRKHYTEHGLTLEQLDTLESIYTDTFEPPVSPRHYRAWLAGSAAMLTLAASLVFFFMPHNHESQILAIASEVAKEHLHQNPLGIRSQNFQSVQNYFRQLDFRPNVSRRFGHAETLLGGRYCSIRTITAAQIRYQANNRTSTLYQVSYNPEYFGPMPDISQGESPLVRQVKGTQIEMWVEKGLFMVSASDIPVEDE